MLPKKAKKLIFTQLAATIVVALFGFHLAVSKGMGPAASVLLPVILPVFLFWPRIK